MKYEEKVLLLKLYSDAVNESILWLIKEFQLKDYSELLFNSDIPKRNDESGSKYAFHGFGCRVLTNRKIVDWDFYPQDKSFVFDLYRINRFLESIGKEIKFSDDEMKVLVQENVLVCRENQLLKKVQYVFSL